VIDAHYANLVSSRLDKFKRVKEGTFNFRCPYCGDSQKYKNKARGYLFTMKSGLVFKCHNCGVGRSFGNFLKEQANDLYDEYVMERYKKGLTGKGRNVSNPKLSFEKPVFKKHGEVQKVSELNKKHPAYEYLVKRNLDTSLFYYTDKFCTWVNTQKPTFTDVRKDHSRIIIPFIDSDGKWFGLQGRSLNPKDKMRYITIMLDENKPKIYGLDRINKTKTVYIVEGPFDSTFLDNSVAMAGSDVDPRTYNWSDYIWVYDNEPRNREIVNRISKSIDRGDKVVIWPSNILQKDINDMVLAGHNVQSLVELNSYQGLEAQVKLTEWKKV
tara:strand:+ start:299 stop:1276 length:978 start_codon:yes stop_codon:yes gene_type:complete